MTISDIMNVITEVESAAPVEQWTSSGVHVWPLIRIQLGRDILSRYKLINPNHPNREGLWERAGTILRNYGKYLEANRVDHPKKHAHTVTVEAIFLSDGVSFTTLGGKYYERFCDPLRSQLDSLGLSSLMLTPLDRFLIPRFSPSRFIQPQLDWIQIKQKLTMQRRPHDEHLPGFELVSERLKYFVPAVELNLASIRRHLSLVIAFSLYFENLLDRVRPRICFLVSYYWLVGYGLLLACRRKSVPSVDIQHGAQGAMHLAYGNWSKVPSRGYEFLPAYFWCWSQNEADVIQRWSDATKGAHRPVVGGNLFLNLCKADTLLSVRECGNLVGDKVAALGADKQVLVTLQWGLLTDDFMQVLSCAMKETMGSLQWWLRLHPSMLHERAKVKELFDHFPNVDIDAATDLPLYALLRHMTVHVTHSSSTVLEANEFGIRSVICSRYGQALFPNLEKEGVLVHAETYEELLVAIDTQRRLKGAMERITVHGAEQVKASERALEQLLMDVAHIKSVRA